MPVYRAAWVVPIAGPPLPDAWIATGAGRIVALGGAAPPPASDTTTDLGAVAVLPALVNAHTHLELSWLRGRVPPALNFIDWVTAMMRERLQSAGAGDTGLQRECMAAALAEMKASGTGAVGDISNSLMGLDLLGTSGLAGVVFHEVLGFRASDAAGVADRAAQRVAAARIGPGWRVSLAAHAPYSVSPALFEALVRARAAGAGGPTAVHVAESPDEMAFIRWGAGRWRHVLERMGMWDPQWPVPGCSPVEYLDRLNVWDAGTLAVHAVQASGADLRVLRDRGVTLVTCPRSNAFTGVGMPPVEAFYASGVRVAVGTDSLSSVATLNLFDELAEVSRLAPAVAPRRVLASGTIDGARALGLDGEYGTIEPGKRAALIAVSVPPDVADVEQYLVAGITPDRIAWIEDGLPC